MFKQFSEVFWPKAKEYVAEQGLNKALNIKDFNDTLEDLQNNLKLLSAKAVDVETEIKDAEDSGRKKRKREIEVWLEQVESIRVKVEELGREAESKGFIMRFLDGGKAAQLNSDVDKLVQQRLHIGEPVVDARGNQGETLLTNEMVGEAFNQNFETILEVLENGQVSRIGVYGMGGVGKTTLAKHIYNRVVQENEGRVVWVTVSHEFTIKSLQQKIAHFMGVELEDEDEEAFRASKLRKILSDKKISVLILDDVWRNIDMREVGCDLEGCRLIISTRSLRVCRQIRCQKEIPVEKLQEGEAWKLFNERLGNEKLDPGVEGIAKDMVKLCDGLPVAITTMARSMRGKKDNRRWSNDFLELKVRVKGHGDGKVKDEVFEVLKFSFDRLKEENDKSNDEFNMIQLCLLYCSLYPEDYHIKRDELVGKFISERLLDENRSRIARADQGHSILDDLVDVCLLESCVDFFGRERVKMHDLVRGMALRICKEKYLVKAGEKSLEEIPNKEEWTKDLKKVSLMQCDIRRIEEGFSPDCPNLSTLLLSSNHALNYIPESFFSKMQGICTLDLCGNMEIAMLPDSISDLTCLKSLLLETCRKLEKVPYLGKMKALRELNLSGTGIKEAPQGLEELLSLRFLSMNAWGLKMLPRGVLLKLGHLEHLSLPFNMQVEIEEIENLKRLEEFSGGVKSVSDFNKFVRSRAHDVTHYRILLSKNAAETTTFEMRWTKVHNNNELELHDCDLKDEKVLGKGIGFLRISRCKGVSKWLVDDLWERFGNPTSLEKLYIGGCRGIEWIMRSEDCQLSSSLEEIKLRWLDDLKGVVGVMERERGGLGIGIGAAATQPPVFPSLKSLFVEHCKKMRKLSLPVSAFPNLEEIEIWRCEEIQEIFEEEEEDGGRDSATILPKLRKLQLIDLPRLRKVGLPASRVPNLKEIFIHSCGDIQEIFEKEEDEGRDFATTLPKLRAFYLFNLPRLRKVGLPAASGVPNLEKIDINGCGEIQEIFEDEDEGRAAGSITLLPELWKLSLSDLPRLKRVSKATIISNSIKEIWIRNCPELKNGLPLHFDGPVPPPFLEHIGVEREWWDSLEWDNPLLPQLLHPFLQFDDLEFEDDSEDE